MYHFDVLNGPLVPKVSLLLDPSIARQDAGPVPASTRLAEGVRKSHRYRRLSGIKTLGNCPTNQAISSRASNREGEKEPSASTQVIHSATGVRKMRHHSPAIRPDTLLPDSKAAVPTPLWDKRLKNLDGVDRLGATRPVKLPKTSTYFCSAANPPTLYPPSSDFEQYLRVQGPYVDRPCRVFSSTTVEHAEVICSP